MSSNKEIQEINDDNDFINVFELLSYFKQRYFIIVLFLFLSLLGSVFYLKNATFEYKVTLKVIPTQQFESSKSNLSGLSISSILGNVNSSNNVSYFDMYKELLKSMEISRELAKDKENLMLFFKNEWDEENQKWIRFPISFFQSVKNQVKNLIGLPIYERQVPGAYRLNLLIQPILINTDSNTGITSISIETDNPNVWEYFLDRIHKKADRFIQSREVKRSDDYINFITNQLLKQKQNNRRESLIFALNLYQQKRISSSSDMAFVAEPFGLPVTSERATKPIPRNVVFFYLLMGFGTSLIFLSFMFLRQKLSR